MSEPQVSAHVPVLAEAVWQALITNPRGVYVDATFGRGGHTAGILARLTSEGRVIGVDRDASAIAFGQATFADETRLQLCHAEFAELTKVLNEVQCATVDGILLDLGVSSPQLDEAERGFSFLRDGPLDMRMDQQQTLSAETWINEVAEAQLAEVLKIYGEERFAKRIANAIVRARKETRITRTGTLAAIITAANPKWEKHKHPATRSFQAIRLWVNQELVQLRSALEQAIALLRPSGRLAVISFHSLEDRLVKQFFHKQSKGDEYPANLPVKQSQLSPTVRLIGKAIKASDEEVIANPRARSAILRIVEKL